jgi:hypothetical protein
MSLDRRGGVTRLSESRGGNGVRALASLPWPEKNALICASVASLEEIGVRSVRTPEKSPLFLWEQVNRPGEPIAGGLARSSMPPLARRSSGFSRFC